MIVRVLRRAALVVAVSAVLPVAASAVNTAAVPESGYMVFTSAKPPKVLQPGPGTWNGVSRPVVEPGLGGLAAGIPRARVYAGREARVELPFQARSVTVMMLRPVRAKVRGGGLVFTRTPMEFRLTGGRKVYFRMRGAAGIVVVYAVDKAGRGDASGRIIASLADGDLCRDWTAQLLKEKKPNGPRATALRRLLLNKCVSPFGVPGAAIP